MADPEPLWRRILTGWALVFAALTSVPGAALLTYSWWVSWPGWLRLSVAAAIYAVLCIVLLVEHWRRLRLLPFKQDASGAVWPPDRAVLADLVSQAPCNAVIFRDGKMDVSFWIRFINRAPFPVTVRHITVTWRVICGEQHYQENHDAPTGWSPLAPAAVDSKRISGTAVTPAKPDRIAQVEINSGTAVLSSKQWEGDKVVRIGGSIWVAVTGDGVLNA